jgi:hypothetical protein
MVEVSTQTDFEDLLQANFVQEKKVLKTPEYHLRSVKRYQEKHKDEIREKSRIRYNEKYQNDPEFREKELRKAKEKREKKKQQQKD